MAMGGWQIAAIIRFASNGPEVMGRIASSTAMANAQLARQRGVISADQLAMERYTARMNEARAASMRLGTTLAGLGFAAGAGALIYATSEAAKFERAMTGVQIATSATASQFKALSNMAFHISGLTAQSSVTIADEMARAAQVAFKNPADLMKLFPMMAKYADVRWIASGGKQDPVETVSLMSSYAHMFSAYGVDAMRKMLDLSAKLQMTTDTSLQQLVTQGRMYIPNASKLGVSMDEIMQYTAIMSQLGFMKGRGGTALNNLILGAEGAVSPTATLSKAKAKGMRDLQMYDSVGRFRFVDEKGHLLLDKMVQHLQAMREQFERQNQRTGGGRWMTDVGGAFGKEAQRLVSVLADALTRQQMQRNRTAFNRIPGVEGQWQKYSRDLFYETSAFKTDIENIMTALALPMLPDIEHGFHQINIQLLRLGDWLKANPDAAKKIFETGVAVTTAFGVRAVAGVVVGLNSVRTSLNLLAASAAKDAVIIDIAAGGGAAAGAAKGGGFLARMLSGIKGVGGLLDGLLLGGAGGTMLKLARGFWGVAIGSLGKALDGVAGLLKGVGSLFFGRLIGVLEKEGVRYSSAFWKDLVAGLVGALKILAAPLTMVKNLFFDFATMLSFRAPMIVDFLGAIGGALSGLGGVLAGVARFLGPLGTIGSLVLTPTQAGLSQDDESAAVAAFNRNFRHGHTVVHAHFPNVTDAEEAGHISLDFTRGAGGSHPLTLTSRSGNPSTHPLLGNGSTVGHAIFGN